jgi:hypothetical protein
MLAMLQVTRLVAYYKFFDVLHLTLDVMRPLSLDLSLH